MMTKPQNMQIANIKSKVVVSQTGSSNDNSISKRLEVMSANFKSTPTIIARDLKIEGEIISAGLIEIEGVVKGTIKGNSVILREEGYVEGTIIAESLSIRGKFDGTIRAKNISITSKAKVIGNIEYDSLSVEDGASIDGQFKMI
jgi:cytoskeletal protein CcmA (bactofilin family)